MLEIKGTYNEIISKNFRENLDMEAYYRITLTDEDDIPDAAAKLRVVYKNLMRLDYDNTRTRSFAVITNDSDPENTDPLALFSDLYVKQYGREMNDDQRLAVEELITKLWEGER